MIPVLLVLTVLFLKQAKNEAKQAPNAVTKC